MKCTENRRYLEPFLDGELDAEANLKVLEHLNLCADCNRTFEAEKTLRAALRDKCCGGRAPAELVRRISATLDAESRRRWLVPGLSAIAAALLATLITAVVMSRPEKPPTEKALADLVTAFHDRNREACAGPSVCVSGGCCKGRPREKLACFFREQTGASTCLHDLDGYDWRSGVIWNAKGKSFPWTIQQDREQGSLVSHVAFPKGEIRDAGADGMRRYAANGREVLMVTAGGFV